MSNLPALFSEVERFMAQNQQQLERAEDVDLSGLEKKIEHLCNTVMELPKPEQVQHVERLTAILSGLNQLGHTLKEQMETVKELPLHRNANVAYKTADARDNFGKRDSKKDG